MPPTDDDSFGPVKRVHVPTELELEKMFADLIEANQEWRRAQEIVGLIQENDATNPPATPQEVTTRQEQLAIVRRIMAERWAILEFLGKEYQRQANVLRAFRAGELN